jgi:RNA polymerase sigma-70 factor (sigma-E family)
MGGRGDRGPRSRVRPGTPAEASRRPTNPPAEPSVWSGNVLRWRRVQVCVEPARSLGQIDRRPTRGAPAIDAGFIDVLLPELARLRRTARLLVGSSDAADDLVGEALARALPKWRSGRVVDPVGYVRVTLVNLATKRWRRRAVGRRLDHRALDWLPAADPIEYNVVERDAVLDAVAHLAPRRRAVVVLRFYEDRSIEEIASILGCADGTVKSQLSRALGQLAVELGGPER